MQGTVQQNPESVFEKIVLKDGVSESAGVRTRDKALFSLLATLTISLPLFF